MGKKNKNAMKKAGKKAETQSPTKANKGKAKAGPKPKEESQDLEAFLQEWSDPEEEEEPMEQEEDEDEDEEEKVSSKKNKDYVKNLSRKDPELFKFLKENDQELLDLDSDDDSSDNEEEKVHQTPDQLEVASDESDYEEEEGDVKKAAGKHKLTQKLLNDWQSALSNNPTSKMVGDLSSAFQAALHSIASKEDQDPQGGDKFRVVGGAMFNAVVRLCLTHMEPSLRRVLKLDPNQDLKVKQLQKSNKWKPLNRTLKTYTLNLAKLLGAVSESSVLCVLLKHVHVMIGYYAALPKSSKHLLQHLISLWSTAEEPVRVLAFLCIIKLTRHLQGSLYPVVVKQMYLAYVKNAKFTSPSTWPVIHFMRRSLAELFALDPKAAYNHAFIYIRQLSINLRNALTTGKKEQIQSVYNWQFVHSVHLWVHLLGNQLILRSMFPALHILIMSIFVPCIGASPSFQVAN